MKFLKIKENRKLIDVYVKQLDSDIFSRIRKDEWKFSEDKECIEGDLCVRIYPSGVFGNISFIRASKARGSHYFSWNYRITMEEWIKGKKYIEIR